MRTVIMFVLLFAVDPCKFQFETYKATIQLLLYVFKSEKEYQCINCMKRGKESSNVTDCGLLGCAF